ncbi:MAG TPA: hypothetical protein VEP50_20260 [bacterium]|nr:hypothetical protein [bacterium]
MGRGGPYVAVNNQGITGTGATRSTRRGGPPRRTLYHAVVRQDTREAYDQLIRHGTEPTARARTVVPVAADCSERRAARGLAHVPGARGRAERGEGDGQ